MLMIHCLMLLPLFVGFLCLILVLLLSTICPSNVAITWMGKRELLCFQVLNDPRFSSNFSLMVILIEK